MKYTEGAFKEWGYELAIERFGGELLDGGPWVKIKNPKNGKDIIIKDVIADVFYSKSNASSRLFCYCGRLILVTIF